MKKRKVTQKKLTCVIGVSESLLSRFLRGKTEKMSEESVVRIARSELGLSVQAAKNLWYRFGFEGHMEHPLNETAKHFHLSENMAKSTERSALDDNVRLELP